MYSRGKLHRFSLRNRKVCKPLRSTIGNKKPTGTFEVHSVTPVLTSALRQHAPQTLGPVQLHKRRLFLIPLIPSMVVGRGALSAVSALKQVLCKCKLLDGHLLLENTKAFILGVAAFLFSRAFIFQKNNVGSLCKAFSEY